MYLNSPIIHRRGELLAKVQHRPGPPPDDHLLRPLQIAAKVEQIKGVRRQVSKKVGGEIGRRLLLLVDDGHRQVGGRSPCGQHEKGKLESKEKDVKSGHRERSTPADKVFGEQGGEAVQIKGKCRRVER